MNYFSHGWGMGVGWLIPFLIIVVIYYFVQDKKTYRSDAQDILDKRYASGGISKEEYEEKSNAISKHA